MDVKKVNESFWNQEAGKISWFKKWEKTLEWCEPVARWFKGGELNASYACVDVHAKSWRRDKVAIYWEDERGKNCSLSYKQLYEQVNKYSFVLQQFGMKKGDVVILYLPMIPESVISMLAVARLGAIHSVVFSGFSSCALRGRIDDTQAKFVITADFGLRRGAMLPLKKIVDDAFVKDNCSVEKVFVVRRTDNDIELNKNRDIIFSEHFVDEEVYVEPVAVEASHPLYILYTSGTTGKPKGLVHSTGGYLTYVNSTLKSAFDIENDSVYWCTADIGWVTGHSYVVYGPLSHGATSIMFEGAPDFPHPGRWWEVIEKYKVSIFYTSPTAIRMFMKFGDKWPAKCDLSSLKILGTVGEVINPEVWEWYNDKIGHRQCSVIDTWWQTETGGLMISPAAGLDLVKLKPGSATLPLPGVDADVVDAQGNSVGPETKGFLVIKTPWPGMTIGIYNDFDRFKRAYWSKFDGMYYSGDYALKDKDGYFWLLGRADEVLNIAGHRIGTAEIESAAIMCESIVEAAAIGIQDSLKGEAVVIFAVTREGIEVGDDLKQDVINIVRNAIGPFVTPQGVYFVDSLPKTRSGKIMRRLLKSVIQGSVLGDVSTLEDEASFQEIKDAYKKIRSSVQHSA